VSMGMHRKQHVDNRKFLYFDELNSLLNQEAIYSIWVDDIQDKIDLHQFSGNP